MLCKLYIVDDPGVSFLNHGLTLPMPLNYDSAVYFRDTTPVGINTHTGNARLWHGWRLYLVILQIDLIHSLSRRKRPYIFFLIKDGVL